MAFFCGWASPVDSLKMNQTTLGFEPSFVGGSETSDSFKRVDDFSGVTASDLIIFDGTTAETTSSGSKYIKVSKVEKGSLSGATWTAPGGECLGQEISVKFSIETQGIKKYKLTITGTSKSQFSLDKYTVEAGTGKVTIERTLKYKFKGLYRYEANIEIKEKKNILSRIFTGKPKTYTLKVVCEALENKPITNDDGGIYRADDALEMAWSDTSGEIDVADDALEVACSDASGENEPADDGLEMTWGNTCDVSELAADVKIYSEGQNIIIESSAEQNAVVCDMCGRSRSVQLYPGYNVIPVNANGLHVVKVGEKTAKLLLR